MRLLTASYNLCRQSILYSLQLCEKALKASFAAPIVGRIHQIDDLGSVGSNELAVDVCAIKGSDRSRGFISVHLRFTFIDSQQTLSNFAESLWPGYNFILAE